MNYLKSTFLFIAIIAASHSYARPDIDFNNKSLIKALNKHELLIDNFEELQISSNIKNSQYINGKYFKIKANNVSHIKYMYVGRVNSCRAGGCSISDNHSDKDSESEYFDYIILFDENKSVLFVKVFNYKASHGYEITAKGWLKQFIGYTGLEQLRVNKNVDSISGATISVYAITGDIEVKTELLNKITK